MIVYCYQNGLHLLRDVVSNTERCSEWRVQAKTGASDDNGVRGSEDTPVGVRDKDWLYWEALGENNLYKYNWEIALVREGSDARTLELDWRVLVRWGRRRCEECAMRRDKPEQAL